MCNLYADFPLTFWILVMSWLGSGLLVSGHFWAWANRANYYSVDAEDYFIALITILGGYVSLLFGGISKLIQMADGDNWGWKFPFTN